MLNSNAKDKPLGVQILGCEEKFILKALEVLQGYDFDVLDFNSACPAKKVVRRGEGASLLKDPKKLNKLLKLVVKNSKLPVTVKIRIGWDKDSINARETALYAQDAGVSALFVHGRTRTQGYSGVVNYGVIRDIKKALHIPVIASGDVFSPQLAKKMFDETGSDALNVARGALGNPWIFKEIEEYMKKGVLLARPDVNEIVKIIYKHLEALIAYYGERNGVILFRKFFIWYTKGFKKIRPLREECSRAKTNDDMVKIIFLLTKKSVF